MPRRFASKAAPTPDSPEPNTTMFCSFFMVLFIEF